MKTETDFQILFELKKSSTPVSGTYLSEKLHISRSAVWKRIKTLKTVGYSINSASEGYQLISAPYTPVPEEIIWHLKCGDKPHVQIFKEIDSTNKFLMDLGRRGTRQNHIIAAETQTAGRGRFNRTWVSERGAGIYMSILLNMSDLPFESEDLPKLTPLAAVSVVEALLETAPGLDCVIKWPNDIFLSGKKLAGILTEAEIEGGLMRYAVIGIGLNLKLTGTHPDNATALENETGITVNQNLLIASVYDKIKEAVDGFSQEKWEIIFQKWHSRSMLINRQVTVQRGDFTIAGTVEGFESNCSMRIRSADGKLHRVNSGDATLNK
ncbi:MAG: biotin--[acetyl-CoA-carboxylase] ligase [Candidatus Omnitrophica bacterium]|nr:biotin--[acetyl-CoA-carboxylase] ligase [Candidatus Omnitrophota bacterium]